MALRSQIASIVANQVGRMQGELEARIQVEALKLVSKFANQCPTQEELIKIVKVRNNLLKVINNFQKLVNRFSGISSKLRPPITAARTLITLLKANPIPSAVIPPSGGVGITLGKIVTLSDRLRTVTLLLEALEDDINSVDNVIANTTPSLTNIKQILDSLNVRIQNCVEELQNNSNNTGGVETIKNLLTQIQPLENTGSEGTPDQSFTYRSINGKDYTLTIIEDRGIEASVPRRVAVAKDNLGVIILRGQPSFSSDTQVLLDELKFRIDNQLP